MNEAWPEWKRAAQASFSEWLETLPDEEPERLEEKSAADLYTLAEELTALKQEMRTLGRNTARLADAGEATRDTLMQELPVLMKAQSASSAGAPDREALLQARREAEQAFLIELGDLSEALDELRMRPVEMAWPFYVPDAVRKRLLKTQSKPLEVLAMRVKTLLSRHALTSLAAVGAPFDAERMNVAGLSNEEKIAPGCVSAVVRQGFMCGNTILRLAEVIVEEQKA